ncbi:sulfotransferase domain-containing protein [Stigmatella aurantiaca]|uniref:Sulfotransferase n=1 Tax=Stigmatella aurantiaca (strain DW4/3-1) TaxID=378806 RepID=Q091S1_STIAD|nr:sulfotransferase domain-containing protein [Stigmatella aurantiaca]ADO71923.1 Sulfotransferase [Stigmatella aurantiaca DW4/3-1]EAU66484.1 heparan sulfate glucosamine 3-O-sulfotransferase 3B1 [Stigmatella aurantiaca DW4/3-1]
MSTRSVARPSLHPSFILIGPPKSGSTSLWYSLSAHPGVAVREHIHCKEPSFFWRDDLYARGIAFYLRNFPEDDGSGRVTFECTQNYFSSPDACRRIHEAYPDMKLIVVLREPVARAYSLYTHLHMDALILRKLRQDPGEGERILARHPELLDGGYLPDPKDERYHGEPASFEELVEEYLSGRCSRHWALDYLGMSEYIRHIERWTSFFNRQQMLFVCAEELFSHYQAVLRPIQEFAGLPPSVLPYRRDNQGELRAMAAGVPYVPPKDSLVKKLREHFAPLNRELFAFLGRTYPWG